MFNENQTKQKNRLGIKKNIEKCKTTNIMGVYSLFKCSKMAKFLIILLFQSQCCNLQFWKKNTTTE